MRISDDAVYSQQVLSSYSHLPLTLSVSTLNSILLGFVLSAVASMSIILIWIGIMVAHCAVRLLLWSVCRRAEKRAPKSVPGRHQFRPLDHYSREFCGVPSRSCSHLSTKPTCSLWRW